MYKKEIIDSINNDLVSKLAKYFTLEENGKCTVIKNNCKTMQKNNELTNLLVMAGCFYGDEYMFRVFFGNDIEERKNEHNVCSTMTVWRSDVEPTNINFTTQKGFIPYTPNLTEYMRDEITVVCGIMKALGSKNFPHEINWN